MTKDKRSIIVFCAHPDDEVIGPGGTLLKYAKEGVETHVVIFSGGEKSHAHYKKEKLIKLRKKESDAAGKVLQVSKIHYYMLNDMKLTIQARDPVIRRRVKNLILKVNPEKIFTHAIDDMVYIDHRGVHDCVMEIVDEIKEETNKKYGVYTFNIWSINIRKRDTPKLLVDITEEFGTKIDALQKFKSQKLALIQLTPVVWIKALLAGFKNDCKFAEEFYKVK